MEIRQVLLNLVIWFMILSDRGGWKVRNYNKHDFVEDLNEKMVFVEEVKWEKVKGRQKSRQTEH